MEKYEEYGYNIQDGKVIIPEWETEIKKGESDQYVSEAHLPYNYQ